MDYRSWASKKKNSLRSKVEQRKRQNSANLPSLIQSEDSTMDIDVDVTVDLDQCTKATDAPAQTNKNTATTTTTPPASINRHYKYLTNSQLLNLQLQDPEIRIHFLTQFLIISSYLSQSIDQLKKNHWSTVIIY